MTDIGSEITAVFAIIGGLAIAFGGWSSLSIGSKGIWSTMQLVAGFVMGYMVTFLVCTNYADMSEWLAIGLGAAVGVGLAIAVGILSFIGPYVLIVLTGAIIAPYLLVIDNAVGKIFEGNKLAREEFVISFVLIFALIVQSSSKTTEMECHRFKYMILSSVVGGWFLAEGVFRFAFNSSQVPSTVSVNTIKDGAGERTAWDGLTNTNAAILFVVWGSVTLLGFLHQLAMRWGLCCYHSVNRHMPLGRQPENLRELPPGATLASHDPERARLVCENCFATVPVGTAFCTECGEALPEEGNENRISVSQAAPPNVSMSSADGTVPYRWKQVSSKPFLSTTSMVDPSIVSKSFAADPVKGNRSIRFMDKAVADDGSVINYQDSTARPRNYDQSFRSFAMSTYSIANRAVEPVETPNIRKYRMSGSGLFHLVYSCSALVGILWLVFLFMFYPREHPCSARAPSLSCDQLVASVVDGQECYSSNVNVDPSTNRGYCIQSTPVGQWIMYSMFLFSEFLNYFLGLLFNYSMWRPIRRGARYLNDFKPPLPKEQWPTVDIFLCHYMEPVEDSLATLRNCLAMQYPPELLRVFILDDGYCKSTWDADNHFKVTVNVGIIKAAGDLRGSVARLMYQKVVGPVEDDNALKQWRRQHSSVRELKKEGGRGVQRRDCAVGSLSDDYDYRDRGIPRVTFIGRMKPEVHHSKAGNINNALFNEGADGRYILILDNDMKPHPRFLLAVIPFFFSEGESINGGGRQYSDDISWNQVAYVQTPQYFEETPQLTEMGDPCGHKNTIFFDAVQCGRDGYDSAAFAGTNALFRRQAFDSIGGIQYGTQTEDSYTGNVLHTTGWDSIYFRKDFEGEAKDRIRLCEGAVPETVASSMGQRKRWAKGAVQILLMTSESEVDPDWHPPRVPAPDAKPNLSFPRKMFYYDSVLYPFGSIPAMCYIIIAIYYLCTGNPPIYTAGLFLLYTFLPLMLCRWLLNLLANRAVDNNDVWRAQQTWFSYSFITMLAIIEAIQARISGREKSWSNTGAGQRTSWTELPNVVFFFTLCVSQVIALIRFFDYESATAPWNYVAACFFGCWIQSQLFPMVKMSLMAYAGTDYTSVTFTANVFGSLVLIFVVIFVQLWQHVYDSDVRASKGLTDF